MTDYTAAGLPYPVPTDDVYRTARYIRDLQDAIDTRMVKSYRLFAGQVTVDANGMVGIPIPGITTVQGAVVWPIANNGNAYVIRGQLKWFSGAIVTTYWTYLNNSNGVANTGGYTALNYAGALSVAAIAWGV